jgi:long-chain acyl-CoA synthetase
MNADFWDDKRPAGVSSSIDLTAYPTVLDVFEHACEQFADRPAFSNLGVTLDYARLRLHAQSFAGWLQTHTQLQPGDRIAVQMPNVLQYPIVVFGALLAGLVVVNTNPLYTAREMRHQFKDSDARALVYLNLFGDKVQEVLADTDLQYLIEARLGDLLPAPRGWLVNQWLKLKQVPAYDLPQAVSLRHILRAGLPAIAVAAEPQDTAVLQYTGGTTGLARGAMLSHRNLVANMLQLQACFAQRGEQGERMIEPGQEVMIAPLPLYHVYAFTANCMCMVASGNHSILITNPRDIAGFIKELGKWQFSGLLGLNTLFVALMEHPDFQRLDFSRLKITNSGGSALAPATAERWQAVTGCRIVEGYGLTETSPVVCANPYGPRGRLGSVGLALPATALKVIDEQGVELASGERGELCVQGPQVMKGYWNDPQATAQALDSEGWLKTGDIAIIDADGFVRIVDRKKDMIIVSGFNVYPNEIEAVIMAHPQVAACAVIGVPDARSGEALKLFVVARDAGLDVDALRAWCKTQLTGYKIPQQIVLRDALPMSAVGKILRRVLRETD